jgi:hypothetical protein
MSLQPELRKKKNMNLISDVKKKIWSNLQTTPPNLNYNSGKEWDHDHNAQRLNSSISSLG